MESAEQTGGTGNSTIISGISVPGIERYQDKISITPDSVVNGFCWARHLLHPNDIQSKFNSFAEDAHFPVTGADLFQTCEGAFDFCRQTYDTILFPPGAPRLFYHNLDHALITSITAQKIFLGGLADGVKKETLSPLPPKKVAQLHKLMSIVSSFHEIDDWWKLAYPGEQGDNPNLEQAKKAIIKRLSKLGLSTLDFDRLLVLDDFTKEQDACVEKSLTLTEADRFLKVDNHIPSLLEGFSPADKRAITIIASNALNAADFLQVINPAYVQPSIMEVDGISHEGHLGPHALAQEMHMWRKDALNKANFGDSITGVISWDTVKLSEGFFKGVALNRINSGMDALKIFSLKEYENAQKIISNKLSFLAKEMAKEKSESSPP